MATYVPLYPTPIQLVDTAGDTLVNGTLEFYLSGTTTATDLFTSDGTSIGTTITLNSMGMPESGGNVITLFRDQSKALKIVGKNSSGAVLFTSDGIPAVASFDSTSSTKLDGIETGADVTDATNVAAAGALMTDGSTSMAADLPYGAGTFPKYSTTSGITASPTQTQAGGIQLVSMVNEVATVATAGDAVTLPAGVTGRPVWIFNNGANAMGVFPPVNGTINGGTVDAVFSHSAGFNICYTSYNGTDFETSFYGAASYPELVPASGIRTIMLAAAMDSVTDTAACSVANYFTTLTTTGASVPTLADGVEGQVKKIQMIVDVGNAVLTPANLTGGTTITYADVGDVAELIFTGGSWQVQALYNIVDGATAPTLA